MHLGTNPPDLQNLNRPSGTCSSTDRIPGVGKRRAIVTHPSGMVKADNNGSIPDVIAIARCVPCQRDGWLFQCARIRSFNRHGWFMVPGELMPGKQASEQRNGSTDEIGKGGYLEEKH